MSFQSHNIKITTTLSQQGEEVPSQADGLRALPSRAAAAVAGATRQRHAHQLTVCRQQVSEETRAHDQRS